MHRRVVIIVCVIAVLAVLAGCSSAGELEMRPVNDTELADRASRSTAPTQPWSDRAGPAPWEIATTAIENGSTTVAARLPPVEPGLPFEHDGAYYNLSYEILTTHEATMVSVEVDYNASNTSGEAIRYAELPAVDKALLDAAFPQRQPADSSDGPDFGVSDIYSDADLDRSVLAPTQQYSIVIYDGERYRITIADTRSVTVNEYEYRAREVADSTTAYATQLRSQYLFTFESVSTDQQTILATAIDEGSYYAESTDDAAFERLVTKFRNYQAIKETDATGMWLLRYEGTVYLVELRYGAFTDST